MRIAHYRVMYNSAFFVCVRFCLLLEPRLVNHHSIFPGQNTVHVYRRYTPTNLGLYYTYIYICVYM